MATLKSLSLSCKFQPPDGVEMRYSMARNSRIINLFLIGALILVQCCGISHVCFALAPPSQLEDENDEEDNDFQDSFIKAARSVRAGRTQHASSLTSLNEDHLNALASTVNDFSIETRDLPAFPTAPPHVRSTWC